MLLAKISGGDSQGSAKTAWTVERAEAPDYYKKEYVTLIPDRSLSALRGLFKEMQTKDSGKRGNVYDTTLKETCPRGEP